MSLALLAALAAPPAAAADEPFDTYYRQSMERGGWLQRLNWKWGPLEAAAERGAVFPTIAVVDSGLNANHPEFTDEGTVEADSASCASGRRPRKTDSRFNVIADSDGHGTVVAGLAAAPVNGEGIVGASPFSSVLAVKIGGGLSGLACALNHLAARMDAGTVGLLVVNLSLADRQRSSPAVRRAIDKLVRRGALIVAATGNAGTGVGRTLAYPARLDHVLAIGDQEGQVLLPGPQLDLLAPGGNLVAPLSGSTPGWGTPDSRPATSFATALASGAAAAVWGAHERSDMTAQQLAYLLRVTAGGSGRWRAGRGFGAINVTKALQRKQIPRDDESEPNETAAQARAAGSHPALSCARTCTRGGIIGTTDDPVDMWRVSRPPGRKVCTRVSAKGGGVRARVVPGRRGEAFVRVTTTRKLAAYTLRVVLC